MARNPTCIITEFMSHGDLANFLLSKAEISDMLRDKIIWDVANGIYYLHSRSPPIIHRDLKTPNVLLASIDPYDAIVAKLSDFGTSLHSYWLNGRVVDNPTWLAPEVMKGLEYSIESDVYSFGITLWEICTREQAFAEYDVRFMSQLEDKILKGLRPSARPTIPPAYLDIIAKCTLDNPKERLTMSEVVELLSETFGLAPPQTPDSIRRKKKRAITKSSEFISLASTLNVGFTFTYSLQGRSSKSFLSLPVSNNRRLSAQEAIPSLSSNLLKVETDNNKLRLSNGSVGKSPKLPEEVPDQQKETETTEDVSECIVVHAPSGSGSNSEDDESSSDSSDSSSSDSGSESDESSSSSEGSTTTTKTED